MSIFNRKSKRKSSVETRQFMPYIQNVWNSGVFSVEKNPTVDTAISKIANTISIIPMTLMVHTANEDKEAFWDSAYQLLKDPAVEETPELFYKTLVRHLLNGNAYIFKHYGTDGDVLSLELVDPSVVQVTRTQSGMKLYNLYSGERGGTYTDRDIIHIPYYGEGYNGTIGKGPAYVHPDVIKRNWIIAEYIAMFFDNSMPSRLLVELGEKFEPGSPKMDKVIQEFNEYFQKFVMGQINIGRPLITPPNSKISMLEMGSNVQSDVLKLYQQSCADVLRLYNIPPEVILSTENKYNSLGQKQQDFLVSCIQPLATHIGQALVKGLVDPEYQSVSYIKWDWSSMTETDTSAKVDYITKLLHSGIYTLNESRQALGLSTVDNEIEGSTRWIPSNLAPLTEDIIDSYMAKSKQIMNNMESQHNPQGDDRQ